MFDLSEIELRPGQDEVLKYDSGHLAVPAVPGAGKTFTLAHLAAKLIADGKVQPGKILIVTYMNSAVANFRTRINNFLEAYGLAENRGYDVKTLHSLAVNILKQRSDLVLINDDFTVIDQQQQSQSIYNITAQWLVNNRQRWKKTLSNHRKAEKFKKKFPRIVQSWISYLKMRGINRSKALQLHKHTFDSQYLSWALELLVAYIEELNENAWVDFDDLLINTWKLLKSDAEFCQRLSNKWTYVFEDEAQDSNLVQETILKLIAGDDGNLVRVGDSNQAIMGTFTAANPKVFRDFCARDDVKQESILYSGRSSQDIIDVANYLVDWTRKEHPNSACRDALEEQKIQAVGPEENPTTEGHQVAAKVFTTQEEEIDWIVNQAKFELEDNEAQKIGVLVPNSYVQEDVVNALEEKDLPVESVGDLKQGQQFTISALIKAIAYLAQPQDEEKLLELLTEVFMKDFSNEEDKIIAKLFKEENIEEIIYPLGGQLSAAKLPEELFNNQQLYQQFNRAQEKIKNWLEASVELPPDELLLFVAESLEFEGELLALVQGIALQIRDQLRLNPEYRLIDIMGQLNDLKRSFNQLADKFNKLSGFQPQEGVITVLTAHKSKGLEWDTVFVNSIVHDSYPITLNDRFRGEFNYLVDGRKNPKAQVEAELEKLVDGQSYQDSNREAKIKVIKERIRLLYVAITRAEKNLYLSSHYKRRSPFNDSWWNVKPSLVFQILQQYLEGSNHHE
ncbi:ATP-dependent helicase [Halanaerobacter jeridensis]|uniref:DNA 3'-5' helicase n=1 Tax=Halanaerobacter jeridensis TaxID=706427 RepID=A0A938XQN2_9FIRM|nr:ATP-dependent helicase [Halanaerobacter jeridensis]MBM7555839.1 DNA helicase-2/ATP-dependent DNA helicase PcrA [Halanaerobacter jeridensis]